jgi:hypothetical protein
VMTRTMRQWPRMLEFFSFCFVVVLSVFETFVLYFATFVTLLAYITLFTLVLLRPLGGE